MTNWTKRWIPDALVIVWVLTIITLIMALIRGKVGLGGAVQAWGKGFWVLLQFAMQMCLIMMTGYILACSPSERRLLDRLSSLSNQDKPWQAIVIMAIFSMLIAWVNWGLSLIGSAMLAVAKLNFRDIMGYLMAVFLVYLVITSIAFLILPLL